MITVVESTEGEDVAGAVYHITWSPHWVESPSVSVPKLEQVMRCWRGYLSGVRRKWFARGPADATATPSSLAPINPECFTFLVPAHPGCPGKRSLNGCSSSICSKAMHTSSSDIVQVILGLASYLLGPRRWLVQNFSVQIPSRRQPGEEPFTGSRTAFKH